jgi:hypothetical protein
MVYRDIRRDCPHETGYMGKNEFENVIAEFSLKFESLKQLARQLRNVLFPIRDGTVFAGTFRENGIM